MIYATSNIDDAAARIESELGLSSVAGGRHEGLGTHNRIVPLGDGSFIELLAIADAQGAKASPLGAAVLAGIARVESLLGWAVAVEDVGRVAARLGTSVSTVGRHLASSLPPAVVADTNVVHHRRRTYQSRRSQR